MEWLTPYLSAIVAALVAVFGSYSATKRAAEDRERERDKADKERDIKMQTELAEIRTDIKHLSDEVKKHNNVIERTYKLETEVANLWHRYDEIHSDMKDVKIGGTE